MRRARLDPKFRSKAPAATRAVRQAKLARATAQIRARAAPTVRRGALMLRPNTDNHTFDPASNGVTLNATSNAPVAVSASGYVTASSSAVVLNQIPQGTSTVTRLGRRIFMKAIHIRGQINTSATVQLTQPARVCLVYLPSMDRNATSMPPHNVIWTAQNPLALRQITDNSDFKVLRQWDFVLGGDRDAPTTGQELYLINEMVQLNELETVWSQANTNGSFDDMDKGALCLYLQSFALDANPFTASFNCRVYFHE